MGLTRLQPGACCGCSTTPPCSSCLPASNLTCSWTQNGTPASATLAYTNTTGPSWDYGGGGFILQQISMNCGADGSIVFQFCGYFSGAYYCCDTTAGGLKQTSQTCGASPVITWAYNGTPAPGSDCDTLKNTLGYDNFKVTL